jgi:MOSC domain-containing protein YiiM
MLPLSTVCTGVVASLNVGEPQTHHWRGQTLVTAIVKTPAAGPLLLHGVNFDGDDQANRTVHGGPSRAAYAYAVEDYRWWDDELGTRLEPGRFGENLTLEGVEVSRAIAGERWRIGGTLLEVTMPRVPCTKLAMRMDDPTFIERFARSGRSGAMLAIVEPGVVARGDTVTVVSRPEHGFTIDEMLRIRMFEHERRRELLAIPNLPQRWVDFAEGRR